MIVFDQFSDTGLNIITGQASEKELVSVVILSYNRCKEVLITIDKLKSLPAMLSFKLEIIVVDNASADDTSTQVQRLHPDVTLITKPVNNGVAGWNEGFKVAKGKYFFVLDDDSHIHSGLESALRFMQANPETGILAAQITDEQLLMDKHLDLEDAWKDGEDIAGFIGCGAIISRHLYDKIGGYAEWIYVYTHEFEYAIRCLEAGFRVRFFANCLVIHRVSNINRSNKRMRIFATRNELAIVYKYFSDSKAKYLSRILINNLKFIKREGVLSGCYVLKGLSEFLKLKRSLVLTPVRKEVQDFYARNFWGTKSVFINLNKKYRSKKINRTIEHAG
jgi:GT2 family glycosyltransferase